MVRSFMGDAMLQYCYYQHPGFKTKKQIRTHQQIQQISLKSSSFLMKIKIILLLSTSKIKKKKEGFVYAYLIKNQ